MIVRPPPSASVYTRMPRFDDLVHWLWMGEQVEVWKKNL